MNPFRHLEISAQDIIDCDIKDCCIAQRKVNDSLEVFER